MRVLWLPHHHWEFIRRGQREFRLAELIKEVHDVHFLTWRDVRSSPTSALGSLRRATWSAEGFSIHQTRRIPNFLGKRVHEASARGLLINERLHGRAIRQVVAREHIDVVLCGIGHQSVGLPPRDLNVPVVFDYLDFKLERWPDVEAEYMARADAVICTSQVLVERAQRFHPHCYYLPNGVDVDAASNADGDRARREWGLDGAKVVSLIGLTASTRLFYVDALAAAARDIPGLVFLLVGDESELSKAMSRRAEELGLRAVATGPVPPSEVADFYAATDVGLYPGDQNAYFDAACPLKILEYTAAGKPVVASDLAELRNWNFPNVRLASASAGAFCEEIKLALAKPAHYPDLDEFRWSTLSERLLTVLDEVVARGKLRPRPRPS
jgi:glycosyltransferase involved in cell wall biosynthesis